MAEIVNLNRFRKSRKRAEAAERATTNRAQFGRTKAERKKAESDRRRAADELDRKRLDPD
jgi:hypothetical protein